MFINNCVRRNLSVSRKDAMTNRELWSAEGDGKVENEPERNREEVSILSGVVWYIVGGLCSSRN